MSKKSTAPAAGAAAASTPAELPPNPYQHESGVSFYNPEAARWQRWSLADNAPIAETDAAAGAGSLPST